jgi:hypothetical protein
MNVNPLHDPIIVQRLMKENVLAITDGRRPADVAGGM